MPFILGPGLVVTKSHGLVGWRLGLLWDMTVLAGLVVLRCECLWGTEGWSLALQASGCPSDLVPSQSDQGLWSEAETRELQLTAVWYNPSTEGGRAVEVFIGLQRGRDWWIGARMHAQAVIDLKRKLPLKRDQVRVPREEGHGAGLGAQQPPPRKGRGPRDLRGPRLPLGLFSFGLGVGCLGFFLDLQEQSMKGWEASDTCMLGRVREAILHSLTQANSFHLCLPSPYLLGQEASLSSAAGAGEGSSGYPPSRLISSEFCFLFGGRGFLLLSAYRLEACTRMRKQGT